MTRFTKSGVLVASSSFAGGVKVYARFVFFFTLFISVDTSRRVSHLSVLRKLNEWENVLK